ncbi:MAG: hypothetical protein ACLGJB_14270, partial [Blastocatellia bacterium]
MTNNTREDSNTSESDKRAALARLLAEKKGELGFSPLSYGQQRLWFLSLLDPDLPAYNMLSAVRLSGHLSFRALLSS